MTLFVSSGKCWSIVGSGSLLWGSVGFKGGQWLSDVADCDKLRPIVFNGGQWWTMVVGGGCRC